MESLINKKFRAICLVIIYVTFFYFSSFSQLANIWYFGDHAGVDFNGGIPVALTNGALSTYEGCASICDDNGSLYIYTDGMTVYGPMHNIMMNGTGLIGNSSSSQAALIVPSPMDALEYYVFTTGLSGDPFAYSIVNMTGGLGTVLMKNTILLASSTEKLTAVKAANGTDYWIVVHESGNNLFYAYNLSNSGISAPVISAVGSNVTGLDCAGTMKLNPQGTKLAMTMEQSWNYELFDFNNATGVVSNGIILGPINDYTYSCEFSPNGQFLYVNELPSAVSYLYQYNVTLGSSAAINASKNLIGVGNGFFNFGTLQNGPDGKIYVVRENKDSLGVINNPNVYGMASNFQNQGVSLGGNTCMLGLPNFVTSYFDITTGIADNPDLNFSIFPNPVTTVSQLTFSNNGNDKILFNLYDIAGRITESAITNDNKITISKGIKPAGIYLFSLFNEHAGSRMNGKIVVSD